MLVVADKKGKDIVKLRARTNKRRIQPSKEGSSNSAEVICFLASGKERLRNSRVLATAGAAGGLV